MRLPLIWVFIESRAGESALGQQLRRSLRRRDMNILRRLQVTAGVIVATAAIGAMAGLLVASSILVVWLEHITP
jgi:hypothetical protein